MVHLPKLEEKLFQLAFMDQGPYRLGIFRQKIQTHPQAMLMHSWDPYGRSANGLKGKPVNKSYIELWDRNRINQIFVGHTPPLKNTAIPWAGFLKISNKIQASAWVKGCLSGCDEACQVCVSPRQTASFSFSFKLRD